MVNQILSNYILPLFLATWQMVNGVLQGLCSTLGVQPPTNGSLDPYPSASETPIQQKRNSASSSSAVADSPLASPVTSWVEHLTFTFYWDEPKWAPHWCPLPPQGMFMCLACVLSQCSREHAYSITHMHNRRQCSKRTSEAYQKCSAAPNSKAWTTLESKW